MTSSPSILSQYEIIAAISGQMLQMAHANDWDAVVLLSQRYQEAVECLRQLKPLDEEDRQARKALLSKILDDDARIRNLAAPELVRLGALLGNMKRHQNVLQAYCGPAASQS